MSSDYYQILCLARCHARADQEGVPPARDEATSGCGDRAGRRRSLQEGRRGVRGLAGFEEAGHLRPRRRSARRRHGRRVQRRLLHWRFRLHESDGRHVRWADHLSGPAVEGPARSRCAGPVGPGTGGGRVWHHQAAAGRYGGALPALQRLRSVGRLIAGTVYDLPRPRRRHPCAAILHRRHPHHPTVPNVPRIRNDHPVPVRRMFR